jgi:hypothetical protein
MFEQQSDLRYPEDTQALWRYVTFERLLDLLTSKELYFTHVLAFSDGLEGSLTNRNRDNLLAWFKTQIKVGEASAQELVRRYEEAQEDFYVSCWHMNDFESYLMWKAYAKRGCALRTTYKRLQAAFDRFNAIITGGVVDYVDFARDGTPLGNAFHLVTTKDLPYRDEREFRLVLWAPDLKNTQLQRASNGIRVPVDIGTLIDRVYMNPLNQSIPEDLLALLKSHKIPIHPSNLVHRWDSPTHSG